MDANSPSNSSNTTNSQVSASHHLGQPAAKAYDPCEVAINDTRQETIEFSAGGPPSLNRPLTEEYFRSERRPHFFGLTCAFPFQPTPLTHLKPSLTAWSNLLPP